MIDYFSFTETRICNVFDILQTIPQKKKVLIINHSIGMEHKKRTQQNIVLYQLKSPDTRT